MDQEFEMACFQIITYVGTARTYYINAIQSAKAGNFEEAQELLKQGDEAFSQGHNSHADLITKDANGELPSNGTMILMHAEDQMISAEGFRIISEEFIELYKKLEEMKA